MREALQKLCEQISLESVQQHRNLTVLPILDGPENGLAYLSLKEALAREAAEITEVSEAGSVPNLKVINRADQPVLLIDGEELVGAKQNRIVNTSLLLAAHSETVIPVSCTEQGRWRYARRQFQDSGVVMSSKSRYRKSERLRKKVMAEMRYDAGQSEVWGDVRAFHAKLGTHSPTQAMRDAYTQKEDDLAGYLAAFPLLPGQKGLVVLLNGQVSGLDYISRADAYRHLHEKLVRSHAIEAIGEKEEAAGANDPLTEGRTFLASLARTPEVSRNQPAGIGEDLRYDSEQLGAALLAAENSPVHLTAFAKQHLGTTETRQHRRAQRWGLGDHLRRRFGHAT